MKKITRKDIGISLVIGLLGAVVTGWFWLAFEAFPPPTIKPDGTQDLWTVVFDDRPLVLTFNWYTTSKVFLFIVSFIYTFVVALIGRRAWRTPSQGSCEVTKAEGQQK